MKDTMTFEHNVKDIAGLNISIGDIVGFSWRVFYDYMLMKEALGDKRFKRSLEIGCGFGRMSRFVAEHSGEAWAVDINQEFIKFAPKFIHGINFIFSDIRKFVSAKPFDLVVSIMCLSHFNPAEVSETVSKIRDITENGAWVYLHETTKTDFRDPIPRFAHDYPKVFTGFKLVKTFPTDNLR